MPTLDQVMQLLAENQSPSAKKVLMNHGAREPFYGVKVGDMKMIMKSLKIKKDHALALALYDTGNSDAMYFAGLIADEKQITKAELQRWVKGAYWYMIFEYTVPWLAAESPWGEEIGLEWIESPDENTAAAGWATLSYWMQLRPNVELRLDLYEGLLERVKQTIHQSPNWVRRAMNSFMIALGTQIPELTEKCIETSEQLGTIKVDMGNTACKIPDAGEYIYKVAEANRVAKKKKMVRC
jgi:3-methyladenine DNA glycosylase AlkD